MQNKFLSALFISVSVFCGQAVAQDATVVPGETPVPVVAPDEPITGREQPMPIEALPVADQLLPPPGLDVQPETTAPAATPVEQQEPTATFPALKRAFDDMMAPQNTVSNAPTIDDLGAPSTEDPDAIRAENKRRLEEELKNTTLTGKNIQDFPNRPSLGNLELAPLPGINETAISGPAPMAKSVSAKDLPSEQLLGRITPEVFQELADLERGNTFLKLQLDKERLKNDLEQMKASYRQQRLDEIAKREDVVRTRIQWWQEQEKLRLALEEKQAEEAELTQKLAEKEQLRDQLQQEAMQRQGQKSADATGISDATEVATTTPMLENTYRIQSIRGIGKNLTARLKNKQDNTEITVKKDDILPTGHVVKAIQKDAVIGVFGTREEKIVFQPVAATVVQV